MFCFDDEKQAYFSLKAMKFMKAHCDENKIQYILYILCVSYYNDTFSHKNDFECLKEQETFLKAVLLLPPTVSSKNTCQTKLNRA